MFNKFSSALKLQMDWKRVRVRRRKRGRKGPTDDWSCSVCQLDVRWVGNLKRGIGNAAKRWVGTHKWRCCFSQRQRQRATRWESIWLARSIAVAHASLFWDVSSLPSPRRWHKPFPPSFLYKPNRPKPIHRPQPQSTFILAILLHSALLNWSASQTLPSSSLNPFPFHNGHVHTLSSPLSFINLLGRSCFCKFLQWFRHHMGRWSC